MALHEKAPEGTPVMHMNGFVRGKGKFIVTEYIATDERTGPRFPLLLTTGRILSQYNVGAQTRRTENVVWHEEDRLEIHPHDAEERGVRDGDWVELALPRVRFEVLAIPGHTLSHVAYVGAGLLLCGDTLFSLGCGRLFEGTPAQMLGSLDRLSLLPGETLVCGGHEYTEANGRFARTVEPANAKLQQRLLEVAELRARLQPTLPVALASELATNPFLRVDADAVAEWCRRQGIGNDRVARFAAVREAKDGFRG